MRNIDRKNGGITKVFAETLENTAYEQIKEFGDFEPYSDCKIRIMPDCHAGAGCTIGTTMEIKDKITPNLVGVDIGCGMTTVKLFGKDIDLEKLDSVINEFIPSGHNIHSKKQAYFDFSKIIAKDVKISRAELSIGTLGGGNHFIEVSKDSDGSLYLIIHSGSRNIGARVAKYYQDIAISKMYDSNKESRELIKRLKLKGRHKDIQVELSKLEGKSMNKNLAYLEGKDFDDYFNDMIIMQRYASLNRQVIAEIILDKSHLRQEYSFETVHNYIDFNRMILRKGAVSAEEGEELLIPINMRDGSILARGKGNSDWNYSAPHGAGRLMSRNEAKKKLNLDDFKCQMKDIYSTSVIESTLDEAPDAYKSIDEIVKAIKPTVKVLDILKPIYNFKAH